MALFLIYIINYKGKVKFKIKGFNNQNFDIQDGNGFIVQTMIIKNCIIQNNSCVSISIILKKEKNSVIINPRWNVMIMVLLKDLKDLV